MSLEPFHVGGWAEHRHERAPVHEPQQSPDPARLATIRRQHDADEQSDVRIDDHYGSFLMRDTDHHKQRGELLDAITALQQELKEARYLAKVLVSAWDDDCRPPRDVILKARAFEVGRAMNIVRDGNDYEPQQSPDPARLAAIRPLCERAQLVVQDIRNQRERLFTACISSDGWAPTIGELLDAITALQQELGETKRLQIQSGEKHVSIAGQLTTANDRIDDLEDALEAAEAQVTALQQAKDAAVTHAAALQVENARFRNGSLLGKHGMEQAGGES